MIRLLAASLFLTVSVAPAFACDYLKSVSTDSQKRTVASQPASDHSTPQKNTTEARKPS
jgi:hypothetical protein